LVSYNLLNAQNLKYEWAHGFGGSAFEAGYDLHLDDMGNIYITGIFQSTVDFDPGPGTVDVVSSNYDAFILKLNPAGEFAWVKTIGPGPGQAIFAKAITTDASGNVYAIGSFDGSADFDPGPGSMILTDNGSPGYADAYIVKLNSSGDFEWAHSFGGVEDETANTVVADESGNVYVGGYYGGTVDFDPGMGNASQTASSTRCAYITKFNTTGDFIWAKSFNSPNANCEINSLDVDTTGNVYSTGWFVNTLDFDPGSGISNLSTSFNRGDAFISKLDSGGNYLWAKSFGSAAENDVAHSISVDIEGNIYTAGTFQDSADFDPGTGETWLKSQGNYDIFISKLDSNGDVVWAKSMGGIGGDLAKSISIDNEGFVYTTGQFRDSADFDPGDGTKILAVDNSTYTASIFVSKLDPNGNYVWAEAYGGQETVGSEKIAVDGSGNVYTTGWTKDTVEFIPGSDKARIVSKGNADMFILKLGCEVDKTVTLSHNILKVNSLGANYQWINCKDNSIINGATSASFKPANNGEYAVIVSYGLCSDTSDCINVTKATVLDKQSASPYLLYPNPTTSHVVISNFSSSINKVTVIDVTGKTIKAYKPESFLINLGSLPKGVYFIQLSDEKNTSTQRIIKQ